MTDGQAVTDRRSPVLGRARHNLGSFGGRIHPWGLVVGLFLGSKIVLSVTGVVTSIAFWTVPGIPSPDRAQMWLQQQEISPHRSVNMWFAWDSFIYDELARASLTDDWTSFAFPLLYPFLGKALAPVLGGNTAIALLVISNLAFLLMLYYAYRLGERLLGDAGGARRFTTYLVLLPTAFLFQAALTESLFLCLTLACFHYAERRRWLLVGVIGFFLGTSRSVGFLVAVPLALVLLQQHRYRLGPRALWGYLRTGWPLLLIPAGWLTFMAFCRWRGGDWFAYKKAQEAGWDIKVQNPVPVLYEGLTNGSTADAARVWFAVAVLVIVLAGLRRAWFPYLVYSLIMVAVPLSMGPPVYKSLLRYLLAVFPVALALAHWTRNRATDVWLSATMALLQGGLFVVWLIHWTQFII